jgi:RNA polymerase sigma factor (sigma-70 family)
MEELNPEKDPRNAWNLYQPLILRLVRDRLTWMSGPRGCDNHLWKVIAKVKNTFFRNFSESIEWPESVQSESKTGVHFTQTPKTPQTEAFWRKMFIPVMVDGVVEGYVTEERTRLWDAHKAIVISILQEALPASARQFDAYYSEFLSKFVFRKFDAGYPEGRSADEFEEWLKQLVREVVVTEIPKLINDKGELFDEELVRMATSHVDEACVQLMERYSPKIKKIVAGIVYKHNLCPPSQDVPSFIEDAAQNVCVKIMANLGSYRFERPFRFWVRAICTNETLAERRDEVGRKEVEEKPVPRVYISWEELLEYGYSPVTEGNTEENTERADILKKIVDKYIEKGRRAEKSWRAIHLKWFEDLDVEEIAVRLNTTEGYVSKMFSHDYRELRRILDDFGSSGTDL